MSSRSTRQRLKIALGNLRNNSNQHQKENSASREKWERQHHEDNVEIVGAIDRVVKELVAENKEKDTQERKKAFREYVTIFLIFLTFIVAGVGDYFFNGQISAMKDADRTTRDSFQLVQRAFVVVTALNAKQERDQSGKLVKIRYSPTITNSGSTPTKNLKIVAINPFTYMWARVQQQIPDAPPPPEDIVAQVVKPIYYILGPKVDLPESDNGFPIDGIAYQRILSGQVGRFYYGIITYNDIFDDSKTHVTKYCFNIGGMIIGGGDPAGLGFSMNGVISAGDVTPRVSICSHWNCADEECDRDYTDYASNVVKFQTERMEHQNQMQELRKQFPPIAPTVPTPTPTN